mmetsp:Transcript_4201/g.10639  ORF Transcript_4201/g.10639 Transcript_4201/m.10639 type:complete len:269 (+) Transcript_4201:277-1083(+)
MVFRVSRGVTPRMHPDMGPDSESHGPPSFPRDTPSLVCQKSPSGPASELSKNSTQWWSSPGTMLCEQPAILAGIPTARAAATRMTAVPVHEAPPYSTTCSGDSMAGDDSLFQLTVLPLTTTSACGVANVLWPSIIRNGSNRTNVCIAAVALGAVASGGGSVVLDTLVLPGYPIKAIRSRRRPCHPRSRFSSSTAYGSTVSRNVAQEAPYLRAVGQTRTASRTVSTRKSTKGSVLVKRRRRSRRGMLATKCRKHVVALISTPPPRKKSP